MQVLKLIMFCLTLHRGAPLKCHTQNIHQLSDLWDERFGPDCPDKTDVMTPVCVTIQEGQHVVKACGGIEYDKKDSVCKEALEEEVLVACSLCFTNYCNSEGGGNFETSPKNKNAAAMGLNRCIPIFLIVFIFAILY